MFALFLMQNECNSRSLIPQIELTCLVF